MPTRLLVALLPPPPLQEIVHGIRCEFADRYQSCGAQKSPPHITLQAPFFWDSAAMDAVNACLQDIAEQAAPFPVLLRGFGTFSPRVIYIHVHPDPRLIALQASLSAAMQTTLGIVDPQAQHRTFVPHMTVAFKDLTVANFHRAWAEFCDRPFQAEFLVTQVTLLHHLDRYWQTLREFPLASPHNSHICSANLDETVLNSALESASSATQHRLN